jgi:hypothetical protein
MWETALAFAIWGSYGSVLAAAHIDPALTAIARSAGLGIILSIASAAIARLRGPREITAAIPWQSGALWLSGSVLLIDEVLYTVSAVSGPVWPAPSAVRRCARGTGPAWRWPSPAT